MTQLSPNICSKIMALEQVSTEGQRGLCVCVLGCNWQRALDRAQSERLLGSLMSVGLVRTMA